MKAALLLDRDTYPINNGGNYSAHVMGGDHIPGSAVVNNMLEGVIGPSAFRMSGPQAYVGYTSGAPTNQSSILVAQ